MHNDPKLLSQADLLAQYDSIRGDGQPDSWSRARAWMLSLDDADFDLVCRGLQDRVAARLACALVESAVAG